MSDQNERRVRPRVAAPPQIAVPLLEDDPDEARARYTTLLRGVVEQQKKQLAEVTREKEELESQLIENTGQAVQIEHEWLKTKQLLELKSAETKKLQSEAIDSATNVAKMHEELLKAQLQLENMEQTLNDNTCSICKHNVVQVFTHQCMHLSTCVACFNRLPRNRVLQEHGHTVLFAFECPICRAPNHQATVVRPHGLGANPFIPHLE